MADTTNPTTSIEAVCFSMCTHKCIYTYTASEYFGKLYLFSMVGNNRCLHPQSA